MSPVEYMKREARQLEVTEAANGSERPPLLYPRATGDGSTLEIVSFVSGGARSGDMRMHTMTKAQAVRFATRILAEADGLEE